MNTWDEQGFYWFGEVVVAAYTVAVSGIGVMEQVERGGSCGYLSAGAVVADLVAGEGGQVIEQAAEAA